MSGLLWAGAVAAASLSVLALVRAVVWRPLWSIVRRVDAFLADWNGEPARPGYDGRPSMPERMAAVEEQLTPNGGDSLRLADRVVRLEQHFGTEPDDS